MKRREKNDETLDMCNSMTKLNQHPAGSLYTHRNISLTPKYKEEVTKNKTILLQYYYYCYHSKNIYNNLLITSRIIIT